MDWGLWNVGVRVDGVMIDGGGVGGKDGTEGIKFLTVGAKAKKNPPDSARLAKLLDGDRELVRFTFVEIHDCRFLSHRFEFVGIDERQFAALVNEIDRRDVTLDYEMADGSRRPFASIWVTYRPDIGRLFVRAIGINSPTPPKRSVLTRWLHKDEKPVHPERAPFHWHFVSRRSLQRRLKMDDSESLVTVSQLDHVGPKDAEWALQQLQRFCKHSDLYVRQSAIEGIAELTRRYGVTSDEVEALLGQIKSESQDAYERRIAEKSLNDIRRFSITK